LPMAEDQSPERSRRGAAQPGAERSITGAPNSANCQLPIAHFQRALIAHRPEALADSSRFASESTAKKGQ
jgi:hypothetical protein